MFSRRTQKRERRTSSAGIKVIAKFKAICPTALRGDRGLFRGYCDFK